LQKKKIAKEWWSNLIEKIRGWNYKTNSILKIISNKINSNQKNNKS